MSHPIIEGSILLKQLNTEDAKWVQEQLNRGGYYKGSIDGIVGEKTLAAFQKFKKDAYLEFPELIGMSTVEVLASLVEAEEEADGDIQLSEHFQLSEMLRSETAARLRIKNYPHSDEVTENLKALCRNVLDPVRKHYGCAITPTSGYRCPELNRAVKGAPNSQHVQGEAVDFVVPGVPIPKVVDWIRKNLDFDQLIMEFYNPRTGSGWIHCSYRRSGNRKQAFKIS